MVIKAIARKQGCADIDSFDDIERKNNKGESYESFSCL